MDLAVVKSIDYSKQKWWGLSNINVKEFWRNTTARFDIYDIHFGLKTKEAKKQLACRMYRRN